MIKITKTDKLKEEEQWHFAIFRKHGLPYIQFFLSQEEFEELKEKLKDHE